MEKIKDIDFRELLDEQYERDMREQEQDGWDDDVSFEEEHRYDGLDPGFSSWADYYHYMYG